MNGFLCMGVLNSAVLGTLSVCCFAVLGYKGGMCVTYILLCALWKAFVYFFALGASLSRGFG